MIGVIILSINVLVVIGAIIYMHVQWTNSRPKSYIENVGIRYNKGSTENWRGMAELIKSIKHVSQQQFGTAFTDELLSKCIIEIVGPNEFRVTPTTVVSEKTRVAGSIATEKKFPWSMKYHVIVVLQRQAYKTADKSAIAHEFFEHIVPFYRGEGVNAYHKRLDLKLLSDSAAQLTRNELLNDAN